MKEKCSSLAHDLWGGSVDKAAARRAGDLRSNPSPQQIFFP